MIDLGSIVDDQLVNTAFLLPGNRVTVPAPMQSDGGRDLSPIDTDNDGWRANAQCLLTNDGWMSTASVLACDRLVLART
jgi:hypothetical protein